jgi:hypothetical protein
MPFSIDLKLVIKKEDLETVKELLQSEHCPVREDEIGYGDDQSSDDDSEPNIYLSLKHEIRDMYWFSIPIHRHTSSMSGWENVNSIEFYKDRKTQDLILCGSYCYGEPETGGGWFKSELTDFKQFIKYLQKYLENTQIDIECLTGKDGNYCDLERWDERITINDHVYVEGYSTTDGGDNMDEWDLI